MLYHQRVEHIGEKGLCALKNRNLFNGLNDCDIEFDFCENYIHGKPNHVQFYSSSHKFSELLDLTHSKVFSSIKFPLIYKALHYVSFIHDYSRRTWVYFLITKSKVCSQFKELKALLEN